MARLFLIIDGYNLMHAAGLGRKSYGPGDLEKSRKRLLTLVNSRLDRTAAADTTIVFDATQPLASDLPPETAPPMTVLFSSNGRDADTEIELLLATHSSPKQILVISSDHRLHKAARRRRARCIDSEDFLNLKEPVLQPKSSAKKPVTQRPKERRVPSVPPKKSPMQEVHGAGATDMDADYAQDFLNIDVDEIKRSVRKER